MQRLIKWLSITLFAGIGFFIFFLAVTGRSETTTPAGIDAFRIRGVDISAHNGNVDFNALTADSIRFVFIKATEGAGFKDILFHENYKKARLAKLKVGAYHFFRFDTPGYLQALNLLHTLRGKPIDLPVVIDVEKWTNPVDRRKDSVVEQIKDMALTLEDAGYKVMIYTNKDGYNSFVRGRLDHYPVWICSFTGIGDDMRCDFWQYSHRGLIRGIDRLIDLNVFCGTTEQWDSLTAGKAPPRQ